MCGRFAFYANERELRESYQLRVLPLLKPRYNIAPTQYVPIIREPGKLELLIWGLHPEWLPSKQNIINVKIETAEQKYTFKKLLKRQRALMLTNGFYEWQQDEYGKKKPFFIKRKDNQVFALAALWDEDACAVLTTAATGDFAKIHERSPCVVAIKDSHAWLNPKWNSQAFVSRFKSQSLSEYKSFPVSTLVNSPQNDSEACIQSLT